ncbi:MAG: heme-binding protein [Rhodopseudomonas sp.]|uniref:GlcG/HbpS family heme-binding protein n=1 Tax=Rhodopseudomonas sp. TaxID=1078 RepID=UPI0018567C1B|nr:heme-binding protein [Rhodopseudomonas sp.]NVN85246.1 heme-binding protein [Rhodopseudomonas sp.]
MIQRITLALIMIATLASPLRAEDTLVATKSLTPELALDCAKAALAECRKRGFQVAVSVVDRAGLTQVVLRDRFAGPHTVPTATGKAWTAVSFKSSTTDLQGMTQPGMPQAGLRQLPGAVILGGGLIVEAGGSLVAGIGVSGAPGGDADEACAKAGIDAIRDKLDF